MRITALKPGVTTEYGISVPVSTTAIVGDEYGKSLVMALMAADTDDVLPPPDNTPYLPFPLPTPSEVGEVFVPEMVGYNWSTASAQTLLSSLWSGFLGRERVQFIVQGSSLSKGRDGALATWPEVMIARLRAQLAPRAGQMAICGPQNEATDPRVTKSAGVDYNNGGSTGCFGAGFIRFNAVDDNIIINAQSPFDTVDLLAFTNTGNGTLQVSFDDGATYPHSLATNAALGLTNVTSFSGPPTTRLRVKLSALNAGLLSVANLRSAGNPTVELLNGGSSGGKAESWASGVFMSNAAVTKLTAVAGVKFVFALECGINEAILASRVTIASFTAALQARITTLQAVGPVMYVIPHGAQTGPDGTGPNGYLMPDGLLNSYFDAAIAVCTANGVPVLDARPAFGVWSAVPSNYWYDNVHGSYLLDGQVGAGVADFISTRLRSDI